MWFIFFVSLIIICLCVLVHYESLYRISKLNHWLNLPGKYRVMTGVLLSLVAHTIEIWLFGVGYYFLIAEDSTGAVIPGGALGVPGGRGDCDAPGHLFGVWREWGVVPRGAHHLFPLPRDGRGVPPTRGATAPKHGKKRRQRFRVPRSSWA